MLSFRYFRARFIALEAIQFEAWKTRDQTELEWRARYSLEIAVYVISKDHTVP